MSPTFAALEKRIDAHVRTFARALDFDLAGRKLAMTDCWVNVMTRQVVHGLHLHPLAIDLAARTTCARRAAARA